MAHLTPKEIEHMLARLDEVCREAQELQRLLRERMVDRARADQQDRRGQPDRRRTPRKGP